MRFRNACSITVIVVLAYLDTPEKYGLRHVDVALPEESIYILLCIAQVFNQIERTKISI